MKYLVVAIEYFTKWIEAEPVAQITAHKIKSFVWKNIVCWFGVQTPGVRQWGSVCKSPLEKAVRRGEDTTGVFIRRAPTDEWPSGVCQSGVAERFKEKIRES